MSNRALQIALPLLAVATVVAGPASAHPHVWVDAEAQVIFDSSGRLSAIRHAWLFDTDFSAYATVNIDTNNDGKLSQAELKPLVETNMESLKAYDFFTHVYVANKSQSFGKPVDYRLDYRDSRLVLSYTLPLKTPFAVNGEAMLEVGDPEYFVAISFVKKQEVKLIKSPSGCSVGYQPPRDLDAQTMAILSAVPVDQHDLPPDLVQAASVLQNVFTIDCPAQGVAVKPKTPNLRQSIAGHSTLTPADLAVQPDPKAAPDVVVPIDQHKPGPNEFAEETAPSTVAAPPPSAAANQASSVTKSTPIVSPPPAPSSESWLARLWHVFGG